MMRYVVLIFVVVGPLCLDPNLAHAYREDESEAQVEADIERGENKLIEKLVTAEQHLVRDTKKAFKAEEERDLVILRGQKERESPPESVDKSDDSLAEIEREVDALTKPK